MTFIDTIPEDDAEGATADWYTADRERFGYRPTTPRCSGTGRPSTPPGSS